MMPLVLFEAPFATASTRRRKKRKRELGAIEMIGHRDR